MKLRFILLFTVALTFWTSVLYAGAGDGLGLFLDFGQLNALNDDTGTEYQASKIGGVQYDYQFALGDTFSISLFGTEFGGKAHCRTTQNMNITKRAS